MLTRRTLHLLAAPLLGLTLLAGASHAQAQVQPAQAESFVRQTGSQLVQVVDSTESQAQKRQQLQTIVDSAVDVPGIARFALGRFWHSATPQQQQQYIQLFHEVLLTSITGKLGDYRGVKFTVGRAFPREGGIAVQTTIDRPGSSPARVDWVIKDEGGTPKIEDVIAEGTSLRLTQRSDYTSYLEHNGGSIQALITALRQQVSQSG